MVYGLSVLDHQLPGMPKSFFSLSLQLWDDCKDTRDGFVMFLTAMLLSNKKCCKPQISKPVNLRFITFHNILEFGQSNRPSNLYI